MKNKVKFYIGPMSKNIVDAIMEWSFDNKQIIGLIPSRRQIEWSRGYVNNWTTEEFASYIGGNLENPNIILERDHAGPGQGQEEDDGLVSLEHDCKNFDIIHIDPWKKENGLQQTIDLIKFCDKINPNLNYEIGTEESIRKFGVDELESLILGLHQGLGEQLFSKIIYVVIQCGTSLQGISQTGSYDRDRLIQMISLCKRYKRLSKEHNGDYQTIESINEKFGLGLDAINIAPEFGVIETKSYLHEMIKVGDFRTIEKFWKICYDSGKWKKWVDQHFDPLNQQQELIAICGHYVLSTPEFIPIKEKYPIDNIIKTNVKNKLDELYGIQESY